MKLGPWLARFPALQLASERYPKRPDLRALAEWSQVIARLADAPPDMPPPTGSRAGRAVASLLDLAGRLRTA